MYALVPSRACPLVTGVGFQITKNEKKRKQKTRRNQTKNKRERKYQGKIPTGIHKRYNKLPGARSKYTPDAHTRACAHTNKQDAASCLHTRTHTSEKDIGALGQPVTPDREVMIIDVPRTYVAGNPKTNERGAH